MKFCDKMAALLPKDLPWQYSDDDDSLETVKKYGATLEDPISETKLIDLKYDLTDRAFVVLICNNAPAMLKAIRAAEALLAALDQLPYANLQGCNVIDAIGALRSTLADLEGL
jgi:hypothetical protein